jgi:hypothetical protein
MDDALVHFDRQTRRLDADWLRQAELLRAQIEFAGVLDDDDRRLAAARLTAFLANLGGQGTFTHVLVFDHEGRTVVRYATRSGTAELPADHATQSWSFSEVDALAYRVIRAPVRLGRTTGGELLVFAPLNNALLNAIAFPDTRLALQWKDRSDLAHSEPTSAAGRPAGAPCRRPAGVGG